MARRWREVRCAQDPLAWVLNGAASASASGWGLLLENAPEGAPGGKGDVGAAEGARERHAAAGRQSEDVMPSSGGGRVRAPGVARRGEGGRRSCFSIHCLRTVVVAVAIWTKTAFWSG